MKFILNTAVDPHFCALYHDTGTLEAKHEWTDRRKDGEEVWYFLNERKDILKNIMFVGGVTGPGGFSSLRAGAGILNALAFSRAIESHGVRADQWVSSFLRRQTGQDRVPFLLNSFGDRVFQVKGAELEAISVEEAAEIYKDTRVFVELLPADKKAYFKKTVEVSWEHPEGVLMELLDKTPSRKTFLPTYEFPAVN